MSLVSSGLGRWCIGGGACTGGDGGGSSALSNGGDGTFSNGTQWFHHLDTSFAL